MLEAKADGQGQTLEAEVEAEAVTSRPRSRPSPRPKLKRPNRTLYFSMKINATKNTAITNAIISLIIASECILKSQSKVKVKY